MFDISVLWKAPEVNPINRKARTIPGLNVVNVYGRVFFFSWFGFMIAFWSWYAFPPLVSSPPKHPLLGRCRQSLTGWYQLYETIAKDLNLSQADVANSNIVSLTAT